MKLERLCLTEVFLLMSSGVEIRTQESAAPAFLLVWGPGERLLISARGNKGQDHGEGITS